MANLISGAQMRAARGILRWSIAELEERSGVSSMTLKRMEKEDGVPRSRIDTIQAVHDAIVGTGVVRLEGENGIYIEYTL
ncbi:MAG: helix-turn-helix domain-containing protein [Cellvibrionaceae bacterium]